MPNVLVADDEPTLLDLLQFSLESNGFTVTTAPDGQKALDLAKANKYDLVILDVMMPFIDGYHVCMQIVEDPKSPPVLLLTSRDFTHDQTAIKGSGATAFLSKPFEIGELVRVAKELIEKSHI